MFEHASRAVREAPTPVRPDQEKVIGVTTATMAPVSSPPGAMRLAAGARRVLGEAEAAADPLERYAFSHLAALRAAAALLADRARPGGGRSRRPTSVWTLLVSVAPEMEQWATYFASGAGKRVAAEAGLRGAVTTREADDLMRDAEAFLALIDSTLGLLAMSTA
jgi:hypothetical protein